MVMEGGNRNMLIEPNERRIILSQQDIIDAIALYLRDQHGYDPRTLQIEIHYDERVGFESYVLY
jgi:hypothetical protein